MASNHSDDGKIYRDVLGSPAETPPTARELREWEQLKKLSGGARPQYRDADDFDREEDPNARYIGHVGSNSGWIYVPFPHHTYRMTETQALRRNIKINQHPWKEDYDVPPLPTTLPPVQEKETRCHILHCGSPMCSFSRERPFDWPIGHVWVSLQAFKEGARITCKECAAAATAFLKNAP